MMKPRDDLIQDALDHLAEVTDNRLRGKRLKRFTDNVDGKVDFHFNGVDYTYLIEVKSQVTKANVGHIMESTNGLAEQHGLPVLLVTREVYPAVGRYLREARVQYLDQRGNAYLNQGKLFILITGQKGNPRRGKAEKQKRLFQESGVRLIFVLLARNDAIKQPYRTLAEWAGISLASVGYLMEELEAEGYVLKTSRSDRVMDRRKELLERWVIAYRDRVRPKILAGTYRFLDRGQIRHWEKLNGNMRFQWTGEPGGALITKYLTPERLALFTKEDKMKFIKSWKLIPDKQSIELEILAPFWQVELPSTLEHTASPLLVYADLITSGDSRNIATAKKVYEKALQHQFK